MVRVHEVAGSNPVTPTKKGKGERELSLSLFDRSDGEENLLRACGTAIDLDTASIKLDTIGSGARTQSGARRESSIGSESCHSDQKQKERAMGMQN